MKWNFNLQTIGRFIPKPIQEKLCWKDVKSYFISTTKFHKYISIHEEKHLANKCYVYKN